MSKTIQEERLRWVMPIVNKQIKLCEVAKVCPYSARSLKRWVKSYREGGKTALIPKTTRPNTHPNETPIHIKETVIEFRNKTKLCAQKLHWRMQAEIKLTVPVSTIGKILKQEDLVRKYRVKRTRYKYLKAARQPGELIEIDVKHVPGKVANHKYYQYTAIDCTSRWRYLEVYEGETSINSIKFLQTVIELFPYTIKAIKTDNHGTFTNYYTGTNKRFDLTVKTLHGLGVFCTQHNIIHYLIDRGKPAQNGTVERSHREDEEKFYQQKFSNIDELKCKLRLWNNYYNDLEHCALGGKTPNEMLLSKVPNVLS